MSHVGMSPTYAVVATRVILMLFLLIIVGYLLLMLYSPHITILKRFEKPPSMLSSPPHCQWLESASFENHGIKPRARPAFALTKAWLKSESARYAPAPEEIPEVLKQEYNMNDTVPIAKYYFNQVYLGAKALVSNWSVELIDKYRQKVKAREQGFTYDSTPIYQVLDAYAAQTVRTKRGLVIGSEDPWLESFLLEYGATDVTTVEFGTIRSQHPQIKTFTPKDFTLRFLHGDIEPYDFAFTYSSLEHDGLGRYGDVLNPSGDLETMAKMLSVIKPGGFLFLGVPCCLDALQWNAHRIYGQKRFAELFAGWKVVQVFPTNMFKVNQSLYEFSQPVLLVQNTFGCANGEPVADIAGLFKSFKV